MFERILQDTIKANQTNRWAGLVESMTYIPSFLGIKKTIMDDDDYVKGDFKRFSQLKTKFHIFSYVMSDAFTELFAQMTFDKEKKYVGNPLIYLLNKIHILGLSLKSIMKVFGYGSTKLQDNANSRLYTSIFGFVLNGGVLAAASLMLIPVLPVWATVTSFSESRPLSVVLTDELSLVYVSQACLLWQQSSGKNLDGECGKCECSPYP